MITVKEIIGRSSFIHVLIFTETDEAIYHMIQKFSSKYLSPMLQSFMKLSLSLRAYSPTVEMFQQVSILDRCNLI